MQTPPDISHPLIIYLSSTVCLIISARNLVRGDYPMSTVSVSFEIGHRHWIYNTVIIDQSRFNWFKGEARKKIRFRLNWCACDARVCIAHARVPSRASLITHGWRLNLGKKKRGEGNEEVSAFVSVGEGEGEREEVRHKRHECESLLALLFAQEASSRVIRGTVLRARFVYRISLSLFLFSSFSHSLF